METSVKVRLDTLLKYIPTGTTEGERSILGEAFIRADEFGEIITPPSGSPRILVGKKGTGKSAIIDFASRILAKGKVPNISLKPLDIDLSSMSSQSSVGELTRTAYSCLLFAIANSLSANIKGLVSDSDAEILNAAIENGALKRDFVSKVAQVLPKIAKSWVQADLSEILPNTSKSTAISLERAISENIATSKSSIYIFIDDTDQVAPPDRSDQLNRIWAFLLATRELCERLPQVRCVVSLRDEIWRALSSEKAGQRDQTDHFLTLVYYLNPTLDHIRDIFERRFELAARELGAGDLDSYYPLFFESGLPRMPTSEKRTSWADAIRTRSRGRPRDAIQLINALAKVALHPNPRLIDENIFASVMPIYSEERVKLLAQEYEKECPSLREIIRSFGGLDFDEDSFTSRADNIKSHISRLPSSFSLTLFGQVVSPDSNEGLFAIWEFLYITGFLLPRVSDDRERQGYRHINASENPKFVSERNWNEMQAALWEIHPAYRDYLISVQNDKKHSFGLPRKPNNRNKRR
jgi:hypothetical protein